MSTMPLLSRRAAKEVRRQQRRVWEASRAVAAPTVSLVLERPGKGALAAQAVVVIWNQGGGARVSSGADSTPDKDLTFRRLASDGFDVEPGDTFSLDGSKGAVTKVYTNKGMIRAEARLVTGITWPRGGA